MAERFDCALMHHHLLDLWQLRSSLGPGCGQNKPPSGEKLFENLNSCAPAMCAFTSSRARSAQPLDDTAKHPNAEADSTGAMQGCQQDSQPMKAHMVAALDCTPLRNFLLARQICFLAKCKRTRNKTATFPPKPDPHS